MGLMAFLAAGIAFQPMFWCFVALTVSLDAYRMRVLRRGPAQAYVPSPPSMLRQRCVGGRVKGRP